MSDAAIRSTPSDHTTRAIREVLAGARRGPVSILLFAGPAVIASIAYMDPGNFATNIQAGARYQYGLLWVVVVANAIAMLFQAMSAKLGIVTNRNLAQLCREQFPGPVVLAMWIVSEIAAMATDLAEFLGGAIGLSLLFGIPLLVGMLATAAITYAILCSEQLGFRPIELILGSLVAIISLCYLIELIFAPPDWSAALFHAALPQLRDGAAITLAAGIIGATVMPHAIYLHSGLTQDRAPARNDTERRQLLRYSGRETVIALSIAGLVNMTMVTMAAVAFAGAGDGAADIEGAYRILTPLLGAGASAVFLVSLMASGISSSVVGTMAGQVIMQGFAGFRIPVWLRRLVTMIPAFIVAAVGCDATTSLIVSQVVLSIALPVPMIALLILSRRRSVMGDYVAGPMMSAAATACTAVVLLLNLLLLLQTAGIALPGLPPG